MSERAQRLHNSPWQGVVHLTGGGASFLSELLGAAGASRTLLEARVPYAEASLADLLGGQPQQACSGATARALAMTAFQRAQRFAVQPTFGFGLTASLATDRTKRGACRAHIATQTLAHTSHCEIQLRGGRAAQEADLAEQAWRTLLSALGCGEPAAETGPAATGNVAVQRVTAPEPWRRLILGADQVARTDHDAKLIFPGAFNPLHEGHLRMMAIAEARLGRVGAFELSVENPDKPLLDYREIERRLAQFNRPVWLTRLPTFVAKAEQFPGAVFVVGMDTLTRIAQPRYYGGVPGRDRAVAALAALQTRFLAFGRKTASGFQELDRAAMPKALRDICIGVGEGEFRMDLSSTALRG